jgi:chromosomal replication initiation ATPase DnaA
VEPETVRFKKTAMIACRHAARALDVDPEVLSGADRSWEVSRHRALVGYVLIRRLGYTLKDVAKCLGRDIATVSSLISRYTERIADDQEWRKQSTPIAEDCLE